LQKQFSGQLIYTVVEGADDASRRGAEEGEDRFSTRARADLLSTMLRSSIAMRHSGKFPHRKCSDVIDVNIKGP